MTTITRRRGDTFADEIIVTSATTNEAIDITGYSFLMTLDPQKSPATADNNLYQITGTVINGPTGRVEFAPTPAQADQMPGSYYYDVQMIDGAGRIRTIALDAYKYTQDITK